MMASEVDSPMKRGGTLLDKSSPNKSPMKKSTTMAGKK